MPCLFCHKDLPPQLRRSARYCDTNCRSAAYRQRNREPEQSSRHKAVSSDPLSDHIKKPERPSSSRRVASSPEAPSSELVRGLTAALDRILAYLQQGTAAPPARPSAPGREELRHQILSQAPPEAAGYRIILPPVRDSERPRFSPRRQAERPSWYALSPFQLPDDLRLRPDRWYPLIWVDAHGNRMPDQNMSAIPGLYYFVGPPDRPGSTTQSAAEQTQGTSPPGMSDEVDSGQVADPARDIAGADEPPRNMSSNPAIPSPAPSPVKDPAPSAAMGPQKHTPEPKAGELEVNRNDEAATPLAAASPLPAPSLATTPDTPTVPAPSYKEPRPLSAKELQRLCEFVYDVERMTYCLYTATCQALEEGQPIPPAPLTQLTEHERRELRQTIEDPDLSVHLSRLAQQFIRTCSENPAMALNLAPPFNPMPQAAVQQLRNAITHPAERLYLEYALRRQEAALQGLPAAPEPDTSLSPSLRRQIRKLVRDERCLYYLRSQRANGAAP